MKKILLVGLTLGLNIDANADIFSMVGDDGNPNTNGNSAYVKTANTSESTTIANNHKLKPLPSDDDIYSSNHPLDPAEVEAVMAKRNAHDGPLVMAGAATSTYMRCYYKVASKDPANQDSNYEWAVNKDGSYFKLSGYWHKDGMFQWKNMFYTATSQAELREICNTTMQRKKKPAGFYFVAANNSLSFNHTIWSNDASFDVVNPKIDKIVAFGDSLSDTNNIYNASMWVLPNDNSWLQGRFSNGNTWVEYLAKRHNLPLYNWAIGGAAGDAQKYGIIPGLRQEVNSWVEYSKDAKNYNKTKTLFTVLIGGNDLINYNRTVNQIMADVQDSVEAIIANGGKNILILNLPDISVAPVFKVNAQLDKVKIAEQVADYNIKLANYIETLKNRHHNQINIELFNTAASFSQIISSPAKYGIANVTDSCLNLNTDSSGNYLKAQKARVICSNADTFMFWDNLHPTTKMHEILATEVDKFIQNKYSF